jgi:dihydroorotate dehydrogenase (NAD+) catalytic subunit
VIELAPHNKRGLSIDSPLMAGSGAVGLAPEPGESWPAGLAPVHFGAVVTAGITWQPQRGPGQPRMAEIPGGFLLATGDENPGFRRVMEQEGMNWPALGVPVIVALAAADPGDWVRLAEHLEERPGIAGLELQLSQEPRSGEVRTGITAVRHATTLPLLVKLPDTRAADLAPICAAAGADALVIGIPPRAAQPVGEAAWLEAPVSGPVAFPFTMWALRRVLALDLPGLPVIAAGGIQTLADAARCLEMGAAAVQIRGLVWTDPAAAGRLAEGLREMMRLAP